MDYEDIIQALKDGSVPPKGSIEICVGRELEIEEFKRLFGRIKEGKAATKFIEGSYGSGKSFLMKVIEEMALDEGFVVSKIIINNNLKFNKFEEVYKNIVQNLKCKTGTSLEHIIDKWLNNLKMVSMEETTNQLKQNTIVLDNIRRDLNSSRKYANSFAEAIINYNNAATTGNVELANYAQAWLRCDPNIPFSIKKEFGVKGDVTKETSFNFLESLSAFISSIEYEGLIILIDEAEYIRTLFNQKMRDTAYDYIRNILDGCNEGNFQKTLFVFAGTEELYDDPRKGIPSYQPLDDRIKDSLQSSYNDLRKPIMRLEGFKGNVLIDLSLKLVQMHSSVYDWEGEEILDPLINDIVNIHESNAVLTGGKITPREYVKTFTSILDTIQQNPKLLDSKEKVLELFNEKEMEEEEW